MFFIKKYRDDLWANYTSADGKIAFLVGFWHTYASARNQHGFLKRRGTPVSLQMHDAWVRDLKLRSLGHIIDSKIKINAPLT